jgi:hypothetical protein
VQPADLATVATSGAYADLSGTPTLGTAAAAATTDFATAAQGAKADSALQPAAIGTTVQAYDADLSAIAALTSASDKVPYATGAGTWALADFSAAGRALVDDSDASAQRTTLGLGTAAVLNSGTSIGNLATYESYDGIRAIYSGDPSAPGGSNDTTIFARRNVGLNDFANFYFLRQQATPGTGGGFGSVNTNVKIQSVVEATATNLGQSEWALSVTTDVLAASTQSQHVAAYFQTHKEADASSWAIATELTNGFQNPTTGVIAIENGLFVKGTDNNNQRVGLHHAFGRHSTASTVETNEISYGEWFTTPNDGGVYVKKGIAFLGNFKRAIDTTAVNLGYGDVALAIKNNAGINWYADASTDTPSAALSYNDTLGTFALTGAPVTAGAAGAASQKLKIFVGSALYYINLTPA